MYTAFGGLFKMRFVIDSAGLDMFALNERLELHDKTISRRHYSRLIYPVQYTPESEKGAYLQWSAHISFDQKRDFGVNASGIIQLRSYNANIVFLQVGFFSSLSVIKALYYNLMDFF